MDLKLGHYNKDGIEVVDVEGEIDVYTAPRLRELLIDLVNKNNYQLVVNMEKVEFLDSTGLGVLVGGLKRVRAHDGSLDLVCTQERILKIFRITGLTKVFGIHNTVDEAIERALEETPEDEIIDRAIAKRLRLKGKPETREDAKKFYDYLLRQGFSYDLVSSKMREIAARNFEEEE